jgi:AraC-like DNA-binding protein
MADGWSTLYDMLRSHPIDLVVIDPDADRDGSDITVVRFRQAFPNLPIVAYSCFEPHAVRRLVTWATAGIIAIVFHQVDDDEAQLTMILDSARQHTEITTLLQMLEITPRALPWALYHTLMEVFHTPHRFSSTNDMAKHARVSRRTFHRAIAATAVRSAARLLDAARLFKAFNIARNPGVTLANVAQQCGYADVRAMNRQCDAFRIDRPRQWRTYDRAALLDQFALNLRKGAWAPTVTSAVAR